MKKVFFFLSLVLLIGAGCGKTDNTPPTSTSTLVLTNETVVETTFDQQAYLFCQQRGNTIRIRYDSAQNSRVIECVFDNGSACPAASFMNGTCNAGAASDAYPTIAQAGEAVMSGAIPRFCEPLAKPVCGQDGRTYTNACIAEQQGVPLLHENGPCTQAEIDATRIGISGGSNTQTGNIPSSPQATQTAPQQTIDGIRTPSVPTTPETNATGLPGWLEISISLLAADNSTKQASLEQCTISGNTYYLQSERCPDCFSILYEPRGGIVCYPHNDLIGDCPPSFSYTNRNRICTHIWEK